MGKQHADADDVAETLYQAARLAAEQFDMAQRRRYSVDHEQGQIIAKARKAMEVAKEEEAEREKRLDRTRRAYETLVLEPGKRPQHFLPELYRSRPKNPHDDY